MPAGPSLTPPSSPASTASPRSWARTSPPRRSPPASGSASTGTPAWSRSSRSGDPGAGRGPESVRVMPREAEIPRSVLADQVKDRLLQAILEGRYPPGSRIVETRVAREYGVSQAPVREALRGLEAIGVIEINAFRGARVRRPSAG